MVFFCPSLLLVNFPPPHLESALLDDSCTNQFLLYLQNYYFPLHPSVLIYPLTFSLFLHVCMYLLSVWIMDFYFLNGLSFTTILNCCQNFPDSFSGSPFKLASVCVLLTCSNFFSVLQCFLAL